MRTMDVLGAPTYSYASLTTYAQCFLGLLTEKGDQACLLPAEEEARPRRVVGYSCRQLFKCLLETLLRAKPDLTIGITGMQHNSFRNIVEELVQPENVHILSVDKELRAVLPLQRRCDVLVVTHYFGQDLDISALHHSLAAHGGPAPLLLEDRCQGGSLERAFSHDAIQVTINSMGMDKRPCGLGGGFMDVRDGMELHFAGAPLLPPLLARIDELPQERPSERAVDLLKKLPNYLIYKYKLVQRALWAVIGLLTSVGMADGIVNFGKTVRKANPGFEHVKFMKRPSAALRKTVLQHQSRWGHPEASIAAKHVLFIKSLGRDAALQLMPWLRADAAGELQPTISVYNSRCSLGAARMRRWSALRGSAISSSTPTRPTL